MKHLHFECVGGASGDMILGALIELGVSPVDLKNALSTLEAGRFELVIERAKSKHIAGLRLHVRVDGQEYAGEPAAPLAHHHEQKHGHKDHAHDHEHRSLTDIEKMIRSSSLPDAVKKMAVAVFQSLGAAEAKIHGVPVENIHFHEVGATDSILDIVGCCWALHQLKIDSVSVGAIPLGHGAITCAHGVYPNPAPATLELIAGMPVIQTVEPFELVTPTGAALLAAWKNSNAIPFGAQLLQTAYGLGKRSLNDRPNVLRATVYETAGDAESDQCLMLECNLDDTTPELIGILIDDAMNAGALDVTCTPVIMKKQRPGVVLSILCEPSRRDELIECIFHGCTTFGIREYTVHRTKLSRRFETVNTAYGEVKVKVGSRQGKDITHAPEMSDCIHAAREHGVSARAVYDAAVRAIMTPHDGN